jgi:SAM-dependent methyltransferase
MNWKKLCPRWVQHRLDTSRWLADRFAEQVAREVPPGARVLDAGAGECLYRPLFAHAEYVGLDSAQGFEKLDFARLDCLGSLLRLPFRDGSFNAVLSINVLEHVTEPRAAMQEMARVLEPGGTLHLMAPQSVRLHYAPYDFYRFTEYGLRYLAEQAGLRVEEVSAEGGYWLLLGHQLSRATGYLFPNWRPLWLKVPFWPLEGLMKILVSVLFPLLSLALDRLDRKRTHTLGHTLRARKPERAGSAT